ncbi:BTB domain-containing protein, partial [Meloidogyne graminicola]
LIGNRFSNAEFPSIEWELCVQFIRGGNDINIWLSQIGPGRINDQVYTKYIIYSMKDENRVIISR